MKTTLLLVFREEPAQSLQARPVTAHTRPAPPLAAFLAFLLDSKATGRSEGREISSYRTPGLEEPHHLHTFAW